MVNCESFGYQRFVVGLERLDREQSATLEGAVDSQYPILNSRRAWLQLQGLALDCSSALHEASHVCIIAWRRLCHVESPSQTDSERNLPALGSLSDGSTHGARAGATSAARQIAVSYSGYAKSGASFRPQASCLAPRGRRTRAGYALRVAPLSTCTWRAGRGEDSALIGGASSLAILHFICGPDCDAPHSDVSCVCRLCDLFSRRRELRVQAWIAVALSQRFELCLQYAVAPVDSVEYVTKEPPRGTSPDRQPSG
jgi:hypothetical protein